MTYSIRKMIIISALVAALASISGCGQKGPLYLPQEEETKQK